MTKSEIPNEPGDYVIEGIKIIVLPKKIMIDTGERRTRSRGSDDEEDEPKERKGKKGVKKNDWLNDMLDNAQAIVTGEKRV